MQHEKNIQRLKQQLQALGFGDGLEKILRSKICFLPPAFEVPYLMRVSGDDVSFKLFVDKDKSDGYAMSHYDAVLRKVIDLKVFASELDMNIEDLEKKMAGIDWTDIAAYADAIEAIAGELESMAGIGPEGLRIAGLLKFKYWAGTSSEQLIDGLAGFRSQYEISQRFYLSDGRGITTEEAYRFLCSKWIEKKMAVKKKTVQHGRV